MQITASTSKCQERSSVAVVLNSLDEEGREMDDKDNGVRSPMICVSCDSMRMKAVIGVLLHYKAQR